MPFVDKLGALTEDLQLFNASSFEYERSSVNNISCVICHKPDESFMVHLKNENSTGYFMLRAAPTTDFGT
jgi:hypothetical protein